MNEVYYTSLTDRGILFVSGVDSLTFLQGIVTNDMAKVSTDQAIYAAILTPQGKYFSDFFIVKSSSGFLVDCPANQINDLKKRLSTYRLRAKVEIEDQSEIYNVISFIDKKAHSDTGLPETPGKATPFNEAIVFVDPRLIELGIRVILPRNSTQEFISNLGYTSENLTVYRAAQFSLGVPDGSDDKMLKQAFPLEMGFNELNCISFDKGCYIGQEVTTRMKIRKLVKKRLVPMVFSGPPPKPGSTIRKQDVKAGQIFAASDGVGLAMLKLEVLDQILSEGVQLVAEETTLNVRKPSWFENTN
jgi:folate-binding protein YgfZ